MISTLGFMQKKWNPQKSEDARSTRNFRCVWGVKFHWIRRDTTTTSVLDELFFLTHFFPSIFEMQMNPSSNRSTMSWVLLFLARWGRNMTWQCRRRRLKIRVDELMMKILERRDNFVSSMMKKKFEINFDFNFKFWSYGSSSLKSLASVSKTETVHTRRS